MRIINEVEFNNEDIKEYKKTIYMNIIKGMLIFGNNPINISPSVNKPDRHGQLVPICTFIILRSTSSHCWAKTT